MATRHTRVHQQRSLNDFFPVVRRQKHTSKHKNAIMPSRQIPNLVKDVVMELTASPTPERSPKPDTVSSIPPTPALQDSSTPKLPLPDSMHTLRALFEALDTVMIFRACRGEQCFFDKIRTPVENISKKLFTLQRLAQIVTLVPHAYRFKVVPCPSRHLLSRGEEGPGWDNHQLRISFGDSACPADSEPDTQQRTLTAQQQRERRQEFQSSLMTHALQAYSDYLKAQGKPVPELSAVSRWDHGFQLTNIPEIPSSTLPQPPNTSSSTAFLTPAPAESPVFIPTVQPVQSIPTRPTPISTPQSPTPEPRSKEEQERREDERIKNIEFLLNNTPTMPHAARVALQRSLNMAKERREALANGSKPPTRAPTPG
eukprot:c14039_g1_i1.p1 GENE.c14039_g1_i1~~c14039_g1_i1.p1  ORF type:complete len:370 (-),score=40.00 c14039_g1_i1:451-1560(-)